MSHRAPWPSPVREELALGGGRGGYFPPSAGAISGWEPGLSFVKLESRVMGDYPARFGEHLCSLHQLQEGDGT